MEQGLTAICRSLRNWFPAQDSGRGATVQSGTFTISNGQISPFDIPFLPGAYVRVSGSVLNDGIFRIWNDAKLEDAEDEVFTGTLSLMAIPHDFLDIAEQIDHFVDVNKKDKNAGKFTSESIGGYSYARATGVGGVPVTWQEVFRTRLNPYRKMFEERLA